MILLYSNYDALCMRHFIAAAARNGGHLNYFVYSWVAKLIICTIYTQVQKYPQQKKYPAL